MKNNNIQISPQKKLPINFIYNDKKININQKEINNYKCIYCDNIPLQPMVFKHINEDIKEENNKIICNSCYKRLNENELFLNEYYLDKQNSIIIKHIISNYKVSCLNSNCNWEGKLLQLKNHLEKECNYQNVKCSECKLTLLRKDLNSHLFKCNYDKNIKIICKFCNEEIKNEKIEEHFEKCPEIFEDCDKNCGKKIKRKDLFNHKLICPENITKCQYWNYGCKKLIKRKYKEDHEKLEIYNHYNLINDALNNKIENNQKKEILNIINKLEEEIRKKEKNEKFFEKIRKDGKKEKDASDFFWELKIEHQKQSKKNKNYDDDYIPFTGNPIQFFTERENIDNKIIQFENERILYLGNYYNNFQDGKYYYVISKNNLDIMKNTHFKFKIYPDPSTNAFPWIAFGIYIIKNEKEYIFNKLNKYPSNGLYCIDLESNTCNDGKYCNSESDDITDRLNLNTVITMSYLPFDNHRLIIKDKNDFVIEFNEVLSHNCPLRFCFIFRGKDRATIKYDY
jgi:hypothetical protein